MGRNKDSMGEERRTAISVGHQVLAVNKSAFRHCLVLVTFGKLKQYRNRERGAAAVDREKEDPLLACLGLPLCSSTQIGHRSKERWRRGKGRWKRGTGRKRGRENRRKERESLMLDRVSLPRYGLALETLRRGGGRW